MIRPYYQDDLATVFHGKCEDVLPTFAAASLPIIVTDPPYGQTNESYDRGVAQEVWDECFRVTANDACILSFAGSPTYHRIAGGIERAGWTVRQMWAWIYRDGMITSAYPTEGFDRLAPAMDPICFATKGKHLLRLKREGKVWSIRHERSKASPMSDRFRSPTTASGDGHYPRTIVSDGCEGFEWFAYPRTQSRAGDRTDHPNQKPLPVMHWILGKLPPGAKVLDPYAGSGTTGVACVEAGRPCVLIEQNEEYCETAARRLRTARESTALFALAESAAPAPTLFPQEDP